MKGMSFDLTDNNLENNYIAAGRKRVKSWLLGTTATELKSPKTKVFNKSFEEDGSNAEGMSDTSIEPFSPTNRGERIVINVGGSRHETFIGTLHSVPDTRLYWITEKHALSPEYDHEKQEYFFDRHPGLFSYILDYYRTGKLHCPSEICGPLFEEELLFWGIDEAVIEPCCWMNYQKHRDAESFDSLDGDEERHSVQPSDVENAEQEREENAGIFQRRGTLSSIARKWAYWQPRIWSTLEEPNSSKLAQVLGLISMSLIILSVTTFCLETLEIFSDKSSPQYLALYYLEVICVTWFTLEFCCRMIFSAEKLAFFKSPMNWIDFCAIFPFFVELVLRKNNMKTIVVLRVVRITRLFRIFKLSRHSYGLQILGHTLKSSCRELFLLVFFLSIAVIIFSSLIYYAEKDSQAEKFVSIPGSFWWSVVTMTTIGYGDIVPITAAGKCVGIMCALCGVLVIALPIPVIVNNFSLYYSHAQARLRVSGKRKKPMAFGAANALRMMDAWIPNKTLQKQRSEQSDFTAILHSPRRTPLASPTASMRHFAATAGNWERNKMLTRAALSRNSPCPSINSSLNSKNSGKSPTLSRRASHNQADDTTISKQSSPCRTQRSQLPVIRLSPNYESPSINVSPPSTPSKTNSQLQSSIGSPFPSSPFADSSVYSNELYTPRSSTSPSRQELSPIQSPLFLCSPGKSTLSTCLTDAMTTPSTPCSFSSNSSKLASPRGRMGRRNGICILGYQSRMHQKKRPPANRMRKTSNRSYLDSSDSQVSSRRESRIHSNFGGSRDEQNCQPMPSPGVSNTLLEVSRRLETLIPDSPPESCSRKSVSRKATIESHDSFKSHFSSRSSSPLVRQQATSATILCSSSEEVDQETVHNVSKSLESIEENVPKLNSIINGMIFKRRNKHNQKNAPENKNASTETIPANAEDCTRSQEIEELRLPNFSTDGQRTGASASSAGAKEQKTAGVPRTAQEHETSNNSIKHTVSNLLNLTCVELSERPHDPGLLEPTVKFGRHPRTRSLSDVRKKEKNPGLHGFVSVSNSPNSPGSGKFQFTISSQNDVDTFRKKSPCYSDDVLDRSHKQKALNTNIASGDCNMRIASTDEKVPMEIIKKPSTETFFSPESKSRNQNVSGALKFHSVGIGLKSPVPTISPNTSRKFGIAVRSPWARKFGQVHDSGVHSMSLSQTQDSCTIELQVDDVSEGFPTDTDTGMSKLPTESNKLPCLLENIEIVEEHSFSI